MPFELSDNIDRLIAIMEEGSRDLVNNTAEQIASDAAENAPVDKGALKASIYALKEGDDGGEAYAEAKKNVLSANPDVEVEAPSPLPNLSIEGVHAAMTESIVPYAPLIENGYSSREGRPFMEQAGNANKSTFENGLGDLGRRLESG